MKKLSYRLFIWDHIDLNLLQIVGSRCRSDSNLNRLSRGSLATSLSKSRLDARKYFLFFFN
jgi:hypothetical protein